MASKSPEQLLADKRRQAYWRRRRQVERMVLSENSVALDRLDRSALSREVLGQLTFLVTELEGGSSPRLYGAAVRAERAALELLNRGEQLSLL